MRTKKKRYAPIDVITFRDIREEYFPVLSYNECTVVFDILRPIVSAHNEVGNMFSRKHPDVIFELYTPEQFVQSFRVVENFKLGFEQKFFEINHEFIRSFASEDYPFRMSEIWRNTLIALGDEWDQEPDSLYLPR